MKCIACNFQKISVFLQIPNAPYCVQVIPEEALRIDKKIDLTLFRCDRCTLVQLSKENYIKETYYDDYLMSRTYSRFSQKYQTWLAKMFVERCGLANKSIVDVGCGDGYTISRFKKYGCEVLGIEPSDTACELATKRAVKVIRDYVDDDFTLKKKYDAFIACQVFEHISDPKNLLHNIKKFLKVGGYGLIEIPSLVKTLSDSRYYDFFPDHVAYYSPTSLAYMLQLNGFDVLSIEHTANNEYLTAIIRYTATSGLRDDAQSHFDTYKNEYTTFYKKLKNKKVVIWGAGAKGIASISFSNIDTKNILFCVDSDPNKENRYLPGSHIKVVHPDMLLKEKADVVIVTAMMYKDEIIKTLKEKYHVTNKQIAIISPEPHFIA